MTDFSIFSEKLTYSFEKNGLNRFSDTEIVKKLYRLTERMLEVNSYLNLTAITDLDGIIMKHYADSLTVAKYIPEGASVIDIGCGAGFPTLPLAIARPDLKITALDSTAKRITYISETAEMLDLSGINAVSARAEEYVSGKNKRETYDIACARAVARLNVLCELCLPDVKVGGKFVAMKANATEELSESANAIKKLGGKLIFADDFSLISDTASDPRCIVGIEKISETPKNYPRNNSQIKKKPL